MYGNFRHQHVKVEMDTCYDTVVQTNLNKGVPYYKSYLTDKDLKANKE